MNEEKAFEGILGNTCELKILEHLLSLPNFDFNITELANVAKISRQSADKVAKKFFDWDIIGVKTKRMGVHFYQLNMESPLVNGLYYFNNAIISKITGYPIEPLFVYPKLISVRAVSTETVTPTSCAPISFSSESEDISIQKKQKKEKELLVV